MINLNEQFNKIIPSDKLNYFFLQHNRFLAEAKSAEAEVLFLGDSIIQLLQFSTVWNKHFSALHCLNFGIGGDR